MHLSKPFRILAVLAVLALVASACSLPNEADWTRRDMPTDGLDRVVTYNLNGPAGSQQEINAAQLRGVNGNAPLLMQETIFGRMSGSKTQDVQITLEDGTVYQALGMVKTERFAGITRFGSLESATYSAVDDSGNAVCGARVRLQFNRNLVQYFDTNQNDFDSLWYYDVPCERSGEGFVLDIEAATLRSITLNEVWQARIAAGSFFFNWGNSAVIVDGPAADLPGGWWTNWDKPGTKEDAMGAFDLINAMVNDLNNGQAFAQGPWLEFDQGGKFADATIIYTAGDADQYLNVKRIFLNRQESYVVGYRPDRNTPWDFVSIEPVYNFEWNDWQQNLAAARGWNPLNPFKGKLDETGNPKNPNDAVVKEIERQGWTNAPNTSLEQIIFRNEEGDILYTMTIRAHIGAEDSLIMFGPAAPPRVGDVDRAAAAAGYSSNEPRPILYNEKGEPLGADQQLYTSDQWAEWQRESTMWNFLKDNPTHAGAELMVQYRFTDNSEWRAHYCGDPAYICGWSPVEWDLSTSYYFDGGDVEKPWLIMQLLGEVGVRTLGMSYASGLYQGTGMLFAMAQVVHHESFLEGYEQEDVWTFDARALTAPDTLAKAWAELHGR